MAKFIVETIQVHRHVHVIEAENESEALFIAEHADDNWQEYLGQLKVDVNEYTEEQIKVFKEKDFYWDGVSYKDENGKINYRHPSVKF
jgi:hypothetical protein